MGAKKKKGKKGKKGKGGDLQGRDLQIHDHIDEDDAVLKLEGEFQNLSLDNDGLREKYKNLKVNLKHQQE